MVNYDSNIVVKHEKQTYISHIIKLLSLTQLNKVLPLEKELYEIEDKINNSKLAFTDDDASTVALSSNPTSFSSEESAEEYFSHNNYSFVPNKFKMLSVLGSGSFGSVFLADYEHNERKEVKTYAIKKLPKIKINQHQIDQVMVERNILMESHDPFILRLYGTFQTKNELCFVTEVLENGDLFNAAYNGDRLSHEECVFYTAGIVLGLDYLHNKKIAYRDLKPENIMIGPNGYPKIIDFGLAKKLPYSKLCDDNIVRTYTRCNTLCGTPEYVAPEIILGKPYDSAVDIWALGVLIYEMIFRRTPFIEKTSNPDYITIMFTNIVMSYKNGILITDKIDRKTDGTDNARKLITQLLSGNNSDRLGKNNKTVSLLKHPYYLSTNLTVDGLYNQTIEAPTIQPEFVGSDINTARAVEDYDGDQDLFHDF
jgi:serine/threonine protein kinase